MRISESGVGASVAVILQNSGNRANAAEPEAVETGGTNAPGATLCADVIVA